MNIAASITMNTTKDAVWAATMDIARFAWVYGPEGNTIELWEPK